jgi:hypothetical protein
LLKVFAWVVEPKTHVSIRRQMHHPACTTHCLGQAARIQQITVNKSKVPMSGCGLDEFPHPGAQIVVTDDYLAVAQQPVNQIATDEPGCTCYERSHNNPACWGSDKEACPALTVEL